MISLVPELMLIKDSVKLKYFQLIKSRNLDKIIQIHFSNQLILIIELIVKWELRQQLFYQTNKLMRLYLLICNNINPNKRPQTKTTKVKTAKQKNWICINRNVSNTKRK